MKLAEAEAELAELRAMRKRCIEIMIDHDVENDKAVIYASVLDKALGSPLV